MFTDYYSPKVILLEAKLFSELFVWKPKTIVCAEPHGNLVFTVVDH